MEIGHEMLAVTSAIQNMRARTSVLVKKEMHEDFDAVAL